MYPVGYVVYIHYLGIGRGIALKLSACGAQVVAISRTQSDLDSLKQEVSCRCDAEVCRGIPSKRAMSLQRLPHGLQTSCTLGRLHGP